MSGADDPAKSHVEREHLDWLFWQIDARCKDKERVSFVHIHGRFGLEIVIKVAPEDREAIDEAFLVDMKIAMIERTGLLEAVIYLDGDEPEIVREYPRL